MEQIVEASSCDWVVKEAQPLVWPVRHVGTRLHSPFIGSVQATDPRKIPQGGDPEETNAKTVAREMLNSQKISVMKGGTRRLPRKLRLSKRLKHLNSLLTRPAEELFAHNEIVNTAVVGRKSAMVLATGCKDN